mmetsp:Transcript_108466/g.183759  ORF Transcript_108466/g.183759 Transcript_108466/m.183759 type:complete len:90 (+) Transcript_108466:4083-4352(+)
MVRPQCSLVNPYGPLTTLNASPLSHPQKKTILHNPPNPSQPPTIPQRNPPQLATTSCDQSGAVSLDQFFSQADWCILHKVVRCFAAEDS